MFSQFRSQRKKTGGLYNEIRKKKKRDLGSDFIPIHLKEKEKVKSVRMTGGDLKLRMLAASKANVLDPASGKSKVVKIVTVKENSANPHFVRMNVITRGAVVETELGLAKITSRPGQHGVVNAVLVEKK
ncbi:MAG TPA: 30S ribosomal protein S8e [archaeon]|nr:30S ribosomal protein S8e [archaeon]